MSAERVPIVTDEERFIGAKELVSLFGYRARSMAATLAERPGFPPSRRFMPGSDPRWWLPAVKDYARRLAAGEIADATEVSR